MGDGQALGDLMMIVMIMVIIHIMIIIVLILLILAMIMILIIVMIMASWATAKLSGTASLPAIKCSILVCFDKLDAVVL